MAIPDEATSLAVDRSVGPFPLDRQFDVRPYVAGRRRSGIGASRHLSPISLASSNRCDGNGGNDGRPFVLRRALKAAWGPENFPGIRLTGPKPGCCSTDL
jgi:hypothetical protein